jgi:hypothetical protein
MGRRSGIYNEIHLVYDEEWGTQIEAIKKANLEKNRQLELGII